MKDKALRELVEQLLEVIDAEIEKNHVVRPIVVAADPVRLALKGIYR